MKTLFYTLIKLALGDQCHGRIRAVAIFSSSRKTYPVQSLIMRSPVKVRVTTITDMMADGPARKRVVSRKGTTLPC